MCEARGGGRAAGRAPGTSDAAFRPSDDGDPAAVVATHDAVSCPFNRKRHDGADPAACCTRIWSTDDDDDRRRKRQYTSQGVQQRVDDVDSDLERSALRRARNRRSVKATAQHIDSHKQRESATGVIETPVVLQ